MTTRNTSQTVAKHATRTNKIDPDAMALIGLFGQQKNLNALMRTRSGRIQRVTAGKRLGIGKVVGIDETGVMIEKNGRTWRMSLPAD